MSLHPYPAPGQAVAFLAALLGCAESEAAATPLTFQTFDDKKSGARGGRDEMARVFHGSVAKHHAELEALNRSDAGVFVTVNGTDLKGRKKSNVRTLRAWWCDVDTKGARAPLDMDSLPLAPSMVVRTPGGWHLYWIADAPMPCEDDARRAEHETEVKAITQSLEVYGGDLGACDVARVLRVPGFMHHKTQPLPVDLVKADGPRYTRAQIRRAFMGQAEKQQEKQATKAPGAVVACPAPRAGVLKRAEKYMEKLDPAISGQGGHAATFNAALKIVDGFDLTEDEALFLMLEQFNPRCEPPWSEEELRHKVRDACAHAKSRGHLLGDSHNRKCRPAGSPVPSTTPKEDRAKEGTSDSLTPSPNEGVSKTDTPCVPGFEWKPRGLFKVTSKPGQDGEGPKVEEVWIAPPFTLPALVRDEVSDAWRLLIAWMDLDGVSHEEAIPFEMLSGEGLELGRMLSQGGMVLPSEVGHRKALLSYLSKARPKVKNRVRLVDALGWQEGAFVLPGGQVIGQAVEALRFAGEVDRRASGTRGTLEGWQTEVARHAIGNPRLAFALSCAFAGPLLGLVRPDGGGGFNLQGFSSKGKSTCLEAAASVWGRPDPLPTWRATGNGLEGAAAARNDGFLVLDELSQVDAKEAGQVAYMLANGSAKARATREGGSRAMKQWKLIFLSSGEQGLEDKLSEDGKKVRAGQEVRVPDIPCPTSGMLDEAYGFQSMGHLAEHLKAQARKHHGHAARVFLEHLCQAWKDREALKSQLKGLEAAWMAVAVPPGADAQVRRVAGRFALVAVAGELAQRLGVLPWPEGEAERAALVCFKAWQDKRGHSGASEFHGGIAAVLGFLEKHGASRFETWGDTDTKVFNRAGWRKRAEGPVDGWDFFITAEAWKEACQGFTARDVARSCADAQILEPDGQGKLSRSVKILHNGQPRCYVIRAAALARHQEVDAA